MLCSKRPCFKEIVGELVQVEVDFRNLTHRHNSKVSMSGEARAWVGAGTGVVCCIAAVDCRHALGASFGATFAHLVPAQHLQTQMV